MTFLKYLVLVLVVAACVVWVIGYRLPQNHSATRERDYAFSADQVFRAIATPAEYPKWRTGVQRVEMLPDSGGIHRYRETAMGSDVIYAIESSVPNSLFVTRIAQAGLAYGGSWTIELTPTGSGTNVRITEDGEVYNPLFRFVSRFIMGHTRSIDRYLEDLDKRLNSGAPET